MDITRCAVCAGEMPDFTVPDVVPIPKTILIIQMDFRNTVRLQSIQFPDINDTIAILILPNAQAMINRVFSSDFTVSIAIPFR